MLLQNDGVMYIYATSVYHTSNSCECMGVNGEALQLHVVYKKPYFLLQVTRESVSGTASHVRIHIRYYKSRENPYQVLQVTCSAFERAMKWKVCIIITIVPSYTGKKITRLLLLPLLLVLHTRNNTDGDKLVTV